MAEALLPPAVAAKLTATGLPMEAFGLHVAQVDDMQPLVSLHGEQPYVLASTAKVVTSLAGLNLLGPDFRWRTRAYLQGTLADGVLLGDLVIVGGGDARLSSDDLLAWFGRMQRGGLLRIAGNIVLDRSAFRLRESDHAATPEPSASRPHHVRPDALTVDGGVLRLSLKSGGGARPEVSVQPPLAEVRLVNAVQRGNGCSASAQYLGRAGDNQLQIQGHWSPSCGSRPIELAALSNEELSLRGMGGLWRSAGGTLDGQVIDLPLDAKGNGFPVDTRNGPVTPWTVHTSAPLMDYVQHMNKVSHNLMARHLLLSLSPGFPRKPATMPGARGRLNEWLAHQGLYAGDITIDNGSGLSRGERGKPRAMAQLLRDALTLPHSKGFIQSLPVAGVDGTLTNRMHSGAQGQAYLKTGTLNDTRALAGYVRGTSGRWHVFTAMVNHSDATRATPALDALVDWVVRNA